MTPSKAIVIGAGGQIGSALAAHLVNDAGLEVRLIDQLPPERTSGAAAYDQGLRGRPWREWWRTCDATDVAALRGVFDELRPDLIFHLAAVLSARGESDPRRCWSVNVGSLDAVLSLLGELSGGGAYRPVLLWPSSIAAYGPVEGLPYERVSEDFPARPTTMYGVSKVAGELLGAYYARRPLDPQVTRATVDFRCLRFPGLLSATPPGGGSSDYANAMYFQAAGRAPKESLFVERRTRMPFMHMDDAVRALVALARADERALRRRVYNVSAFAPSVDEFAASIRRRVPGFDFTCDRPDHRQQIVDSWPRDMDDSAARADWGYAPRLDLDGTSDALLEEIARS